MDDEEVLVERDARVATVTLNRPHKRNALNERLLAAFSRRMGELDASGDVSVIIVKGAGPCFSAGYDIAHANDSARSKYLKEGDVVGDRWRLRRNSRRWLDLWELRTPVIAQVHGHCLAGASELALMCDLVVAADDAKIGFPAVRGLGVPPLSVYPLLMGIRKAKELLFTGDSISGAEAARLGLINSAVPAESLEQTTRALAARIAKIPKDLLALNKASANAAYEAMGFRAAALLGAEFDAMAHRTRAVLDWMDSVERYGLRDAVRRRDARFEESG